MKFIIILMCSAWVLSGCRDDEHEVVWRIDSAPISRRIPVLKSCTNLLWHGEIISKESFLSPPGPSAYRVGCIIPNASQSIRAMQDVETSFVATREDVDLLQIELLTLQNKYDIDSCADIRMRNESLDHVLIQPPCWGKSVYFKDKDVLFVVLYGE